MTVRDLAFRAKVDPGYLSRVERGARGASPRWVADVADVFDIPAESLLLPDDRRAAS